MLKIFIVSDATGETAERVVRAGLVQFADAAVSVVRRRNVRTPEQIRALVHEATAENSVVFHGPATIASGRPSALGRSTPRTRAIVGATSRLLILPRSVPRSIPGPQMTHAERMSGWSGRNPCVPVTDRCVTTARSPPAATFLKPHPGEAYPCPDRIP